jgi:hypothetical protein
MAAWPSQADSITGAKGALLCRHVTPIGKPPPLAVRLAEALPFRRAHSIEERRTQCTTACIPPRAPRHIPGSGWSLERWHGKGNVLAPQQRRQGVCRAFRPFPRVVGPLWGGFIKLPALRVVHDCKENSMKPVVMLPLPGPATHVQDQGSRVHPPRARHACTPWVIRVRQRGAGAMGSVLYTGLWRFFTALCCLT